MSETKQADYETEMENPGTNQEIKKIKEIKLTCKTLFNKRGELSSFRCAIFSSKVTLMSWLFLFIPMMAMYALYTLIFGYLNSLLPSLPF